MPTCPVLHWRVCADEMEQTSDAYGLSRVGELTQPVSGPPRSNGQPRRVAVWTLLFVCGFDKMSGQRQGRSGLKTASR